MKIKNLLLAAICGIFAFASCSDDDKEKTNSGSGNKNVPIAVQKAFKAKYSNVKDVKWDVVKDYHVARFNAPINKKSGTKSYSTSAWFTKDGKYCQSDEEIEINEMPAAVSKAFNAYKTDMYPNWEIDDCEIVVREGMGLIYIVEIEKGKEERNISISETGIILKDVLDDDDEDDILPVVIPQEANDALKRLFPDTFANISILEFEIDDNEIEFDIIENDRHKEVGFDSKYNWLGTSYDITPKEFYDKVSEETIGKLISLAKENGIDIYDENIQKEIEIEVVEDPVEGMTFEIEIETDDLELDVYINGKGDVILAED